MWTKMAVELKKMGWTVKAGLYYDYEIAEKFLSEPIEYCDLRKIPPRPNFTKRVLNKLRLTSPIIKTPLDILLTESKPDTIIISQGNNMDGIPFMKACKKYNIPFYTITQLTSAFFWPFCSDEMIDELNVLFGYARKNFFVSKGTLEIHNKFTGQNVPNSAILPNPFTKIIPEDIGYPPLQNGFYKVALIGRIELFHKGYDLLLDVIKTQKWQERNIQFSIYGNGPHVKLLKRLINKENIQNLTINAYLDDISVIWRSHHILLMPSRMEGQSLTLIEALHFKRPVIATDVGGTIELLTDEYNGFLAKFSTPESIDEAMERAWLRRDDWCQLGINGKKHISTLYPVDPLHLFYTELNEMN